MEKEQNKKAYTSAEKEVREEDVKKLKEVIKATLKKLAEKEKAAKVLAEEIKILKNDIKDFKEGRLDRIAERQKESAKAKETSVFKIIKKEIHHHHYDHYDYPYWRWPYWIETKPVPYYEPLPVYCGDNLIGNADTTNFGSFTDRELTSKAIGSFTCSGSTAKAYSSGTYQLGNDNIKMI